ncbi:MAG: PASTA domain-containing protein, partial [Muribaculaceae bacterium]|nr:PASTA domain-containing protein [Muribaculaceae bacterium]
TSGEVVKNIALKLYSRGMLDNESDYTDIKNPGTTPTFFATRNNGYHENLRDHLTIGASRVIKTPAAAAKGVPDVTGMGAREAIAILESAGYNVAFKGTGYVGSQSPAAGQTLRRGGTVNLALYN